MQNSNPNEMRFIFSSFPPKGNNLEFQIVCKKSHKDSSSSELQKKCEKLGSSWLGRCDILLRILMKNPDLADFKKRVDEKFAPNYYSMIKDPMDFTTLQRRLRTGAIDSPAEFKRCLDLIWNNCRTYNGANDELSLRAQEYQHYIDSIWEGVERLPKNSTEIEIKKLTDMKEKLRRAEAAFTKIYSNTIPRRETIPPFVMPKAVSHVPKLLVNKVLAPKPIEVKPTQIELLDIQEKLSSTPPDKMKEAWDILIPFLKNDEVFTSNSFNLNSLPDKAKIDLKRAVLR